MYARAAIVVIALAGCNPYDRDLGPSPFLCGPTAPRCPKDYTCMTDPATGADVCFAQGASAFMCADDSAHEPNETVQTAMALAATSTVQLDGLAICPIGDVDTFSMVVHANQSIEALVAYDAVGATLVASILDPVGAAIANAMPVAGTTDTIRAVAPQVPAGTYFVQISARKGINNYALTVNLTP